ncbi:arylamine N-acetyltransferase, pineal gland isozyme NAT-10-like [Hypomesus transpacificus]|uniref:arylamine N-acetyltransferase, pineal gland isozyme NAT-10-like n=1 Tax=Hypomesus transpacificus TaxID=137520 RepID=UPI001F07C4EF|nr:arylamine N-acetyltransferase, pineal gland isozyme NAT-10-like [Hypomesus transpacificus]
MNLEEYFKKIGFHGPFDKPDLETLRMIHKQHVMSIPFENLSIHCGEKITMDLELIFNKLVKSKRGGWCCENNLLFSWVLRELGYNPIILGSRVFNTIKNEFNPTDTHLINKIYIDGTAYIADVSYGVSGQIWYPLELVSGKDQTQPPGVFRLIEDGDIWILEKTGRKPLVLDENFANSSLLNKSQTKRFYCFTLVPKGVDHFLKTTHCLQTDPNSLFTNKSICSLQTATGFRVLVGCTLSEVTFNYKEGVDLLDMKDIPENKVEDVLKEKFNVVLVNKLVPVNNKAAYTF